MFRDVQPVLLRYLHIIGPGSADDIASETWVQVVSGLHKFRGDERSFRAWLFTIARHRAVDFGALPAQVQDFAHRMIGAPAAQRAASPRPARGRPASSGTGRRRRERRKGTRSTRSTRRRPSP